MAFFGLSQALTNAYQALVAKFPIIQRDNLTPNNYYNMSGASTSSGSYVLLYTASINTRGGALYFNAILTMMNSSATGQLITIGVQVDGGGIDAMMAASSTNTGYYQMWGGRGFMAKPLAGSHTINVYWAITGGATATIAMGGFSTEEVAGD